MSIADGERLDPSVFSIDPRMKHGRYTDQYFLNVRHILSTLAAEGYGFEGESPLLAEDSPEAAGTDIGNINAEMQCFTKREPYSIVCGVDHAAAILQECVGEEDEDGEFRNRASELEVEGVLDGERLYPWDPCLKIRGRYRDYGIQETCILGVLSRETAVATNTYRLLRAADGKPVFFFPARYDIPATQCADGYAYRVGVEAYNHETDRDLPALVTSEAQGEWWGAEGGGTVSHSYVLSFLGDCAESMLHFCRLLPIETKRIALVDTTNDCIRTSRRTALKMFARYRELKESGRTDEAEKFRLFGVRCDTAGEISDRSIDPLGDPKLDCGVVPRLVTGLRKALDELHNSSQVPEAWRDEARDYFQDVKIVASGGFDVERISRFERLGLPVDVYGVGSAFFTQGTNDFTADIVRVQIEQEWTHMAKVGRRAVPNPDLRPIPMR
jgi:nicotinate phosphoribosyltransferase